MADIFSTLSKNPILLISLLVVGVLALAQFGGTGQTVVSSPDDFVAPRYGTLSCKATGAETAPYSIQFLTINNPTTGVAWYQRASFTCTELAGCRVKGVSYNCGFPAIPFKAQLFVNGNLVKETNIFSGAVDAFDISNGDALRIDTYCIVSSIALAPTSSSATVVGKETLLYSDSHGYLSNDGFQAGTNGCTLTSSFIQQLKSLQPIASNNISVSKLALNTQKNIIVGWAREPFAGSLITYQSQQAICRNTLAIYAIQHNPTVGGTDYHTIGNALKSGSDVCCDNTGCTDGKVCDNVGTSATFTCKTTAPVCQLGSCPFSASQCGSPTEYLQSGSSFIRRENTCGADKCCVRTDTAIKCTPYYCDSISTAADKYVCQESVGCTKITTTQACPNGLCCPSVSNSPYNAQSCQSGQTCCLRSGTQYVGDCRTSCSGCASNADCDDGNSATADICTLGTCAHNPITPPADQTCAEKVDAKVCGTLDVACPIDKAVSKLICAIEALGQLVLVGSAGLVIIALIIGAVFLMSRKKGGRR